jgi:hypothetical protein
MTALSTEAKVQQAAGQAQGARKRTILVAGLAAAFVASLLTFTMAPSNPPPAAAMPAAQAAAAPQTKSCQKVPLVWLVSSTIPDGGTVRLREGNYVSPPIKLTSQPQAVVFPRMRGDVNFVEPIIVEGDAPNIIVETVTHNFRKVYQLNGTRTIMMTWFPLTTCQVGTLTIPVADPQ